MDSLEVDDLRWFDPTGNSLLDTLLSKDSPPIQAELRLRQQVGGAFPAKTSFDLLYRVRNSFLSPDHIGTYTSGVYEAINQLNNDISACPPRALRPGVASRRTSTRKPSPPVAETPDS